jgi:hypothetical protein
MARTLGDDGTNQGEGAQGEGAQGEGASAQKDDGPPAWVADFGKAITDSILSKVDERIKAIPQPAASSPPATNQTSNQDDADAIASRRIALEESLSGLNQQAKDKLRNLYLQERPTDVATWANGYISAFGIQRENSNMDKPQHANASVTSGGVPRNDRAVATANKSLFEMTRDEVKDRIDAKGLAKTGEELLARARRELSGVTLKFENK